MAVTRLSDAIVPSVFMPYMLKETKVRSAIFQAGILRSDANMAGFLSGGGKTVNVPFWKDLADTESNIASDDPSATATPEKITTGQDVAIRQIRTQGWSSADLVAELSGDDPQRRIAERVADYWVRQFQKTLVSTLQGLFLDNITNDSGDMVVTVGTDATGAPTASETISAEAIIDTKQTMGDAGEDLDTIVMHSAAYSKLQKLNLIDFIPDSEGRIRFPTYLGYRVVVDDGVTVITGTNRKMYWTYLIGRDAFAHAEVPVDTPVETDRFPAQGNGMGVEQLWTRRQFIMHPYGIKFAGSPSGQFPTNTELATATSWDRVYPERKQIPLALLRHNL